ncbi:hypothetical protein [Leptothoe sp. PORK10 BA2]|uniref:hypothetical protein n=1 Tax=Leptothoe sp. PORK10 BA2 TaxID=3110254 RepID=UPI002B21D214|nr:hypothetical protein [Leptothoe sp. PORK10 BA2]MEA5464385.1 hypothetical protein [Leptothoe sp. PORK10 BA2]
MIAIATGLSPHTLRHPAVTTVHLLNQSPGAERVGGVTLYLEPIDQPLVELVSTANVDPSYENAVAQGVQQTWEQLNVNITGLRLWWCDWLWHPIDSRPSAFTQAAAKALAELWPWLELTPFVAPIAPTGPPATPPFPSKRFERHPITHCNNHLQAPIEGRWTIKTPLISHVTRVVGSHWLAVDHPPKNRLVGSQSITQTTISFKAIASTQKVCPVDKLPEFRKDNGEIFHTFSDSIRHHLPNARGFDIMVQELMYQTGDHPGPARSTQCLQMLTQALQQAINVGGKSYH